MRKLPFLKLKFAPEAPPINSATLPLAPKYRIDPMPPGFDGLFDQPRSGAPVKLTEDQVIELYEKILRGPDEDDILSRYRISDIKKIISKTWGVDYSTSGLHSLMKRMFNHSSFCEQ